MSMDRLQLLLLLNAAGLLSQIFSVGAQTTPGVNKYYTSSGNTSGYCTVAACSFAACQPWQYLAGCSFNVSGACKDCTLPVLGTLQYYSGTGQFADNCVVSACQTCPNGYYNTGCGGGNPGICTPCGTPPADKYWQPNTGPVSSCTSVPIDACTSPSGYYNVDSNETFGGICVACNVSRCPIGQYLTGCSGKNPGFCIDCTGANSTQEFSTNGLTANMNSCTITGCAYKCPAGQYITGCGGPSTRLGCGNCTNAIADINYYDRPTDVAPAYYSNTCSVATCPTCSTGSYTLGCGGTSPGVCAFCINTQ